jgi:hypothetical protein
LAEFRESKGRAQSEAARALPLRDGNCALERFLGRRRIGWVAHKQHFAADPMQLRFERAMPGAFAYRQRLVEDRDSAVDVACPGFGLGERALDESVEGQDVLLAHKFDAATHDLEAAAELAALGRRQAIEKNSPRSPLRQFVLAGEYCEFGPVRRGAGEVAAH